MAGTIITSLDVSKQHLYQFSETQWQAFAKALAGTTITSLNLSQNGLYFLSEAQWQAFTKALAGTAVTSLNLSQNDLYFFSEAQWQAFTKALASTAVTSLNLNENELYSLSEVKWQAFAKALTSTAVTSLNLSRNSLCSLSAVQWQVFGQALADTTITSLNLSENRFYNLTEVQWLAFNKVLTSTAITSLDLSKDCLYALNEEQWQAIGQTLAGTAVTSLNLGDNYLHTHIETQWQLIAKILTGTAVTSLNLGNNHFNLLTETQLRIFGEVLASTTITSLSLDGASLNHFITGPWQNLSTSFNQSTIKRLHYLDYDFDINSSALKMILATFKDTDIGLDFKTSRYPLSTLTDFIQFQAYLPFYTLDISRYFLTDEQLANELLPLLQKRCPQLRILELNHNQLTLAGLEALLAVVKSGALPRLELLNISSNYIELHSNNQLRATQETLSSCNVLRRLDLSGNCLIAQPEDKLLKTVLHSLLIKLETTIGDFLAARFAKLTKLNPDTFHLLIDLPIEHVTTTETIPLFKRITLELNYLEIINFNKLKEKKHGLVTDKDVLYSLTVEINQQCSKLTPVPIFLAQVYQQLPAKQQEDILDTLADYRPHSPLVSIPIHPVLHTALPSSSPALLSPEALLTPTQGFVYLIVHHNRHTLLGYEYLTDAGQRFMKIAHLTIQGGKSISLFANEARVVVDFETTSPLLEQLQKYQTHYAVVGLRAETPKLKILHENIVLEKASGVASHYKWLSSGILQRKTQKNRVQNCLRWATNHIRDDLGIKLSNTLDDPHQVINLLRTQPQRLIGDVPITIVDNQTSIENPVPSRCLIM